MKKVIITFFTFVLISCGGEPTPEEDRETAFDCAKDHAKDWTNEVGGELLNMVETSNFRPHLDYQDVSYIVRFARSDRTIALKKAEIRCWNNSSAEIAYNEEHQPAGRTFKDCSSCPEMVEIPAGSFSMGSNEFESDEKPVHTVTLSAFSIGKYEVTQGQWEAVMGESPSRFSNCGYNCPVEKVSWENVQRFITKLNAKTGKQYRLPTEAEWEYACRSRGSDKKYCGSNDLSRVAWYAGNSNDKTHPVGQKQANGYGLYDMSGNVGEWVQDWKGDYASNSVENPTGPASGSRRVRRGGSFWNTAPGIRASNRSSHSPRHNNEILGFRLAR